MAGGRLRYRPYPRCHLRISSTRALARLGMKVMIGASLYREHHSVDSRCAPWVLAKHFVGRAGAVADRLWICPTRMGPADLQLDRASPFLCCLLTRMASLCRTRRIGIGHHLAAGARSPRSRRNRQPSASLRRDVNDSTEAIVRRLCTAERSEYGTTVIDRR